MRHHFNIWRFSNHWIVSLSQPFLLLWFKGKDSLEVRINMQFICLTFWIPHAIAVLLWLSFERNVWDRVLLCVHSHKNEVSWLFLFLLYFLCGVDLCSSTCNETVQIRKRKNHVHHHCKLECNIPWLVDCLYKQQEFPQIPQGETVDSW